MWTPAMLNIRLSNQTLLWKTVASAVSTILCFERYCTFVSFFVFTSSLLHFRYKRLFLGLGSHVQLEQNIFQDRHRDRRVVDL